MTPLAQAIETVGSQSALARKCGVVQQHVWNWLNRDGSPPAERCPDIERATSGQVTVEDLRPDVRWTRVADAEWPHPAGRPCIDVAAPGVEGNRDAEAVNAA